MLPDDPLQNANKVPALIDFPVHEKTLRRNLKERLQINFHKAAKKAELTEPDMYTHIGYALEYRGRTEAEWKRMVAVDEKVFSTSADGELFADAR